MADGVCNDYQNYGPNLMGEYTWTVYVGFALAFLVAFGLGANDCANSYGTVVGAHVLKLYQAYLLATFFELLGAGLLGDKVTKVMRESVVNVTIYDVCSNYTTDNDFAEGCPRNFTVSVNGTNFALYTNNIFLLGELGALAGNAFWLIVATMFLLPVSTTHSAVGATIGFSLSLKGTEGINWPKIGQIVISWVTSPLCAGLISVMFYLFIKYTVLVREHAFEASLQMMPFFYFFTVTANLFTVMFHGPKRLQLDKLPWWAAMIISLAIGSICAVIMLVWGKNFVRNRVMFLADEELSRNPDDVVLSDEISQVRSRKSAHSTSTAKSSADHKSTKVAASLDAKEANNIAANDTKQTAKSPASSSKGPPVSCFQSLKQPVDEYPLTNQVFTYLQVMSACFLSFSHGSNDTANAVGPLVGMYLAYKTGHALNECKYDAELQGLIMFGAVSMIVGLWILGHKVIKTIGTKITHVTPPSGFAMELGTAFTVLVSSKIGMPISTTHCAVGAVVCVGWIKSSGNDVSWKTFGGIAGAWLLTLPVSAGVAALVTWFLVSIL